MPACYFARSYFPPEFFGGNSLGVDTAEVQGAPYFAPTYFTPWYFAPTYFASESSYYLFDDLFGAIRRRILDEVSGIKNLFFRYPPPKPEIPFGIYSPIGTYPEQNISNDFLDFENVQITIVSNSAVEANRLGICARNAISPGSMRMIPLFKNGYIAGINLGKYLLIDRQLPSQKYGPSASFVFDTVFIVGRSSS